MSYNPDPGQSGQPLSYSESTMYAPGVTAPAQALKKSRRGLWISLIVIVILLIGGSAVFFVVTAPSRGVDNVVQSYYAAVEQQNYAVAYTYIDKQRYITTSGVPIGNISQTAFTLSAQANDLINGKLTAYAITSTAIDNTTAEVIVNVTRGGTTHPVDVQLQQVNGMWEIDRISST